LKNHLLEEMTKTYLQDNLCKNQQMQKKKPSNTCAPNFVNTELELVYKTAPKSDKCNISKSGLPVFP
jgi:hypothetical protein